MTEIEIKHQLDEKIIELEMLSHTFTAIDIAMSEGHSNLDDCALTMPCHKLREISSSLVENIRRLYGEECEAQ